MSHVQVYGTRPIRARSCFSFSAWSLHQHPALPPRQTPGKCLVPPQCRRSSRPPASPRTTTTKSSSHNLQRLARSCGCPPQSAPAIRSPRPRPWMLDKAQSCPGAHFQFSQSNGQATLTTPRLAVSLNPQQGGLTFKTPSGETLIREHPSLPRTYLHSQDGARPLTTSKIALIPTPLKASTVLASIRPASSTIAAALSNSARTTPTSPSPCCSPPRATQSSGTPPLSATSTIASRSTSTSSPSPPTRSTTTSSSAQRWTPSSTNTAR